ncbi:epoxyqueuosine reductase QueH [Candidatus Saccharibacteria bacterium]|nr:epoxyqueuosine reductase QueH [Candidatus Saccharibacteria bacterium]
MQKILLHTCCAPCSVYTVKALRKEGLEPDLFWYNPNIHPYGEYRARRDCLNEFAKQQELELIVQEEYGLDDFVCAVNRDKDNLNSRCVEYCYPKRLGAAFRYAKEHGYDAITTTLLYSIYQKHEAIRVLMEGMAKQYGVEFIYRDFREGWQEGQDEARRLGLYMQKYCGCVYSEEEATFAREHRKEFRDLGLKPTDANARMMIERHKQSE